MSRRIFSLVCLPCLLISSGNTLPTLAREDDGERVRHPTLDGFVTGIERGYVDGSLATSDAIPDASFDGPLAPLIAFSRFESGDLARNAHDALRADLRVSLDCPSGPGRVRFGTSGSRRSTRWRTQPAQ